MRYLAAVLFLALASCGQPADTAPAEQPPAAAIRVENAWAAPTPGGVDVSAGYLMIVNGGNAPDVLVSASSPRAASVQIHEMSMEGGVMQMRPAAQLEVPAGQSVELAPGGRHLMFIGVTQPFAEGETIPVTLQFERAGLIEVSLPVSAPQATHGGNGH